MSAIRTYLEETREREGDKGWLRREPEDTHPEILAAVRAFVADGGTYNDAAEQYVERCAGDLPKHHYHAHPDRHELTVQLGHEVYIARKVLTDEENRARAARLRAEGFVPIAEAEPGRVYDVAGATLYSGYEAPTYGRVRERCRLVRIDNGRGVFLPPRARTNGFYADHALVREAS